MRQAPPAAHHPPQPPLQRRTTRGLPHIERSRLSVITTLELK